MKHIFHFSSQPPNPSNYPHLWNFSCIEEKGAILSHVQHNSEAKAKQADVLPAKLELTPENMFMPQKVELSTENIFMPPKVELSTENIFIPKTKEMDTGYFIPPELKSTMTCK